jgi:hypothetical protein
MATIIEHITVVDGLITNVQTATVGSGLDLTADVLTATGGGGGGGTYDDEMMRWG